MTITLEQVGVGLIAILGLVLIVGALWFLISLLVRVGKFAAFTGLHVLAGIAIGILIDVRIILLVTANLTSLAFYQGGSWSYLATIFAVESLSLSTLYIVSFLKLEFQNDKEGQITKEIIDAVKAGAGFWGVIGVIFSFSICCFLASNVWYMQAFLGDSDGTLSFFESISFAFQVVLDLLPINLEKSFNLYISKVSVADGEYAIGALVFVYQVLLFLSFTQVLVHFWKMRKV